MGAMMPPVDKRVSTVSRPASDSERTFYGILIRELAAARVRRGFSQEQLDHRLGVSAGLVSKWESFLRVPGAFMLCCWCTALGVDLSVVLRSSTQETIYVEQLGLDPID